MVIQENPYWKVYIGGAFLIYGIAVPEDTVQEIIGSYRETQRFLQDALGIAEIPEVTIYLLYSDDAVRYFIDVGLLFPSHYAGVAVGGNEIMMRYKFGVEFGPTLAHEITHIATSDVHLPRWLAEGVATYVENCVVPGAKQGVHTDELLPVDEVLNWGDPDLYDQYTLHLLYMGSWELVSYAVESRGIAKLREHLASLGASFFDVMGSSPEDFFSELLEHYRSTSPHQLVNIMAVDRELVARWNELLDSGALLQNLGSLEGARRALLADTQAVQAEGAGLEAKELMEAFLGNWIEAAEHYARERYEPGNAALGEANQLRRQAREALWLALQEHACTGD